MKRSHWRSTIDQSGTYKGGETGKATYLCSVRQKLGKTHKRLDFEFALIYLFILGGHIMRVGWESEWWNGCFLLLLSNSFSFPFCLLNSSAL